MPSKLRPDGGAWTIREQIIEDRVTKLTFQFEIAPNGEPVLRVFGDALPQGNREIHFDTRGQKAGAGTATGLCRPAWLSPIDP